MDIFAVPHGRSRLLRGGDDSSISNKPIASTLFDQRIQEDMSALGEVTIIEKPPLTQRDRDEIQRNMSRIPLAL